MDCEGVAAVDAALHAASNDLRVGLLVVMAPRTPHEQHVRSIATYAYNPIAHGCPVRKALYKP